MTLDEFMRYGTHLINLSPEQFDDMFDLDEITELSSAAIIGDAVYLLSQYLVGNHSGTAEEILPMVQADRKRVFFTWIDVVKEPHTLKGIAKFIASLDD